MSPRHRGKVVRGRRGAAIRHKSNDASPATELITFLARGLVEEPTGVSVAEVERSDAMVYQLRVSPGDLGKVIGKNGRTAQAMRTLLTLAEIGADRDLVLDILD
jgi:predicted RNA-binding protein YlqC (UPF0109 family)